MENLVFAWIVGGRALYRENGKGEAAPLSFWEARKEERDREQKESNEKALKRIENAVNSFFCLSLNDEEAKKKHRSEIFRNEEYEAFFDSIS